MEIIQKTEETTVLRLDEITGNYSGKGLSIHSYYAVMQQGGCTLMYTHTDGEGKQYIILPEHMDTLCHFWQAYRGEQAALVAEKQAAYDAEVAQEWECVLARVNRLNASLIEHENGEYELSWDASTYAGRFSHIAGGTKGAIISNVNYCVATLALNNVEWAQAEYELMGQFSGVDF